VSRGRGPRRCPYFPDERGIERVVDIGPASVTRATTPPGPVRSMRTDAMRHPSGHGSGLLGSVDGAQRPELETRSDRGSSRRDPFGTARCGGIGRSSSSARGPRDRDRSVLDRGRSWVGVVAGLLVAAFSLPGIAAPGCRPDLGCPWDPILGRQRRRRDRCRRGRSRPSPRSSSGPSWRSASRAARVPAPMPPGSSCGPGQRRGRIWPLIVLGATGWVLVVRRFAGPLIVVEADAGTRGIEREDPR